MEEKEVLIKVENLSKKFCKDLKKSLWYGLKDVFSNVFGNHKNISLRDREFWALKNINFELRRGECLGLIGHNGAGKSTLLKILNGLINPDEGKVTIYGRVAALIELGAGFNPILSGRENIYNNGSVLGFTRNEIDSKLDKIIDFAELSDFIDMPVQNYSSGMKVRLGFAIAAQMEPDVLIIDEVLAVGDLGFVLKCFKFIDTILPNAAIVFVSHSMPMVSRICSKIILMNSGEVQYQGIDVGKGIDLYYSRFSQNNSNLVFTDDSLEMLDSQLLDPLVIVHGIPQLAWNGNLNIYCCFKAKNKIPLLEFFIIIVDKEQRSIALLEKNMEPLGNMHVDEIIEFNVSHKKIQLSKGIYSINISVRNKVTKEPVYRVNNILNFQILHEDDTWEPFLLKSEFEKIKIEK